VDFVCVLTLLLRTVPITNYTLVMIKNMFFIRQISSIACITLSMSIRCGKQLLQSPRD